MAADLAQFEQPASQKSGHMLIRTNHDDDDDGCCLLLMIMIMIMSVLKMGHSQCKCSPQSAWPLLLTLRDFIGIPLCDDDDDDD